MPLLAQLLDTEPARTRSEPRSSEPPRQRVPKGLGLILSQRQHARAGDVRVELNLSVALGHHHVREAVGDPPACACRMDHHPAPVARRPGLVGGHRWGLAGAARTDPAGRGVAKRRDHHQKVATAGLIDAYRMIAKRVDGVRLPVED